MTVPFPNQHREAGYFAVGKALIELLEEEQDAALRSMERAGRRNVAPAAIDAMVERVFLRLGGRAIKLLPGRCNCSGLNVCEQCWGPGPSPNQHGGV